MMRRSQTRRAIWSNVTEELTNREMQDIKKPSHMMMFFTAGESVFNCRDLLRIQTNGRALSLGRRYLSSVTSEREPSDLTHQAYAFT